jgi:hypothetical protein
MPLDSIESAKVAKLLYLVDSGRMPQARGMNMDNIDEFISLDESADEDPIENSQPEIDDEMDDASKQLTEYFGSPKKVRSHKYVANIDMCSSL